MGTNYYAHIKVIDKDIKKLKKDAQKFGIDFCCFDNYPIHLGRSAVGWKFRFAYNEGKYYKNWEQMKEWLKDKIIEDEYHHIISLKEFIELVESKQKTKESILSELKDREFNIDGYIFCNYEFS